VVGVFATGAAAASRLKAEDPSLATAVFCTDVTAHSMWVHRGIDLYLVTSAAGAASVRRFQPQADVAVVPAPVRTGFYAPLGRVEARAKFGVPEDAPCVLLMSGAWGLGPVAESAEALAASGIHVLAVAGRNPKLEARLRAAAEHRPRLHPFGFTTEVPALMSAADLVVTASGDTCSEARVVGRDLLLLDVVPGHGRDNLQHELELGRARVTSGGADAVVACVLAQLPGVQVDPVPTRGPQAWEQAFGTALERLTGSPGPSR
jgi:UDP-N-acetylglucosamine:LPS N-acetylglucosamine transferase